MRAGPLRKDRGERCIFRGHYPCHEIARNHAVLTEDAGGLPDPRQRYTEAYDNPAFTLHIIGDRLEWLDQVAELLRERADRTGHIETAHGYINGIHVRPPQRDTRTSRPRYDVTMAIDTEVLRQ